MASIVPVTRRLLIFLSDWEVTLLATSKRLAPVFTGLSTFYQIEKSPCWRQDGMAIVFQHQQNFLSDWEVTLLATLQGDGGRFQSPLTFYQIEKSPCWRPTIEDSDSNPQSKWTFYQIEKSPCWRPLRNFLESKLLSSSFYQIEKSPCWRLDYLYRPCFY